MVRGRGASQKILTQKVGSVAPGDKAQIAFRLQKPVACEAGMRFAIREGGKTVGAGVVLGVET